VSSQSVPASHRRWAIAIPQHFPDGTFDPAAFRTYMERAEALGFESAWTLEQVLGPAPYLGPIEAMTYAAACTERIRLGCSVLVTTARSPVHLAKSLASLDQLSRGRVEVGVGLGGRSPLLAASGVGPDGLVSRFNEGMRVVKALWTEPTVDLAGRFFQLKGASAQPKPFQKPRPPVWYGGSHRAALRRAVRDGDGFFGAGLAPTATFAKQVGVVQDELAEAGRDRADFRIAKRVYIAVEDDAARAREHVDAGLQRLYGHFGLPDLTSVAVFGTPEDCRRGLREVADAGAELIMLNPLYDDAEQMERLAAEVLPEV
jgi:probable F420-dependent oxidoreductase